MRKKIFNNNGFTLIELSIVLVIIGLIVGGVLVGTTLIRQAELRSIISEKESYSQAAVTYRTKYNCIPGDCNNAETLWGSDTGCPHTAYTATPHVATCNGNGDGLVGQQNASPDNYEIFRFWQQLSNANLINGSYSGISGAGDIYYQYALIGVNVPRSKAGNAGFSVYNLTGAAALNPAYYYPSVTGNTFFYGTQLDAFTGPTQNAALTGA